MAGAVTGDLADRAAQPWRIRFDPATGDLWIGDVGQGAWEEIDVARAGVGGLDFGWNRMEGFHCYAPSEGCDQTGLTLPVAEYGHDLGCAVIGGVVVRDLGPAGARRPVPVLGFLLEPPVAARPVRRSGRREPVLAGQAQGSISSITEAEDGTVLATDLQNGRLLAVQAAAP